MKEKFVRSLIAVLLILVLVTACATPATPAPQQEPAKTEAPQQQPAAQQSSCPSGADLDAKIAQAGGGYDRPQWTSSKPSKTVRIAYLAYENNPFWEMQKVGMNDAIKEAKAAGLDLQVDFNVVSEKLDPTLMVAAIENSIVQKYDGIYMFPINESMIPALQKAADAGIKIGHIAVDIEGSPRMISVGQDLYNAGKTAGYLMIKQTGGKGKVAIITGQFGVTAHELRTQGFKDALKECPTMEAVGITEAHDSSDESYAQAQNFMSANPDLVGIYLTAGGPFGAARAVEEAGKVGKVFVIGHDVTEQHIPYVKSGAMVTIHQHETWQNHDVIVYLYNAIVDGKMPPSPTMHPSAEIVTAANVDQFWPVQ